MGKEEENGEVVINTTSWEERARSYISGFEGSQTVRAVVSK
jgi:hypothetical protein